MVIENEKTNKKTIKTIYKLKYKNNKIYSPLTNKYLEAMPEGRVKQEFICKLIKDYEYSFNQMAQ